MSPNEEDLSKFEKITRRLKLGNMEMICGTLKEEEHLKQMAKAIQEITEEEHALAVARLIYDLQKQLKKCEESKKKLESSN